MLPTPKLNSRMTELKAIIVYILMLQGIETLANPLLTTTAENFMKLVDSNSDRKCDFPPAIAPSEDTIKLCTESNDQENMPIARTVCDSIVKLSELVCRIQNFSIKVIDVMISLKASKEDLCSHVEIQHLFTTEKCSDIVETGPVFHTLRLYSAMLKSLFKTFEGNKNLTTLHNVIQILHEYFPFPPRGLESHKYSLAKCAEDRVPEPTHGLCLQIRDIAADYARNHWFDVIDRADMYINITDKTWDPCPVLAERNESFKDECGNSCRDENGVICRSLAYGYIHKPDKETAKTQTSVSQSIDTATEKPVGPLAEGQEGIQDVDVEKESIPDTENSPKLNADAASPSEEKVNTVYPKVTLKPVKITEFSSEPYKATEVMSGFAKGSEISSGSSRTPNVSLVTSKAPDVNQGNEGGIRVTAIPDKGQENGPMTPEAAEEHNNTSPDNKGTENQIVNTLEDVKDKPLPVDENENQEDKEQTDEDKISNDNNNSLTTKANQVPLTSMSTDGETDDKKIVNDNNNSLTTKANHVPLTSVSSNGETETSTTSKIPDDNVKDDEGSGIIDIDDAEQENVVRNKPDTKQLDSQFNQVDTGDTGGISFMSYFLVFVVLCVAGYILFHNKQKIIALVIEGKNTQHGRRPSSKDYNRLKTDDVMPSLEKSASSSNYVY